MRRPTRNTAVVVLVALLGIVLAAAVTWGTSQLVRQRIGLASEPLTAGQRLLPPALTRTTRTPTPTKKTPREVTTTVTTTVPPPPPMTTSTQPPTTTASPTTTSTSAEPAPSSRGEGSDSTDHSSGRDD